MQTTQNNTVVFFGDKYVKEKQKTSSMVRLLSSVVAFAALTGGFYLMITAMTEFSTGWYALAKNLSYNNADYEEAGSGSGENEETGDINLRPFIIICTIVSIVTEISIAIIVCKIVVVSYHRTVRSVFSVKRDNALLNITAFFVMGLTIYWIARAFSDLHLHVTMNSLTLTSTAAPSTDSITGGEYGNLEVDSDEIYDEVHAIEESESNYSESYETHSLEYDQYVEITPATL